MKKPHQDSFKNTSLAFWSVITALSWEILEEVLENLLAQTLTYFIFFFVAKIISVLAIFTLTKGIKTTFIKVLKPFIRNLTYKEGYDKMSKVSKFFYKIGSAIKGAVKYVCISNPRTSLATLIAGCMTASFGFIVDTADVMQILNFPDVTLYGIEIIPYALAIGAFVIINLFGINYGRESNSEADERKLAEKQERELKLKEKEEKAKEQERLRLEKEFEENALKLANEMEQEEIRQKAEAEETAKKAKEKEEQERKQQEEQERLNKRAREILKERQEQKSE